jgi:hypothetical protein
VPSMSSPPGGKHRLTAMFVSSRTSLTGVRASWAARVTGARATAQV